MPSYSRYSGDVIITYDEPTEEQKTIKEDKYVQAVKQKFEERSQTGIRKYNTTLEREDLNFLDWLNHLQEELMDATLYVERLKTSYAEETTKSSKTSTGELH